MGMQGLFGLGLVCAETGKLYLEHGAPQCNDIYAEVEPDAEFYLQLSSNAPEVVYVDLFVDGIFIEKGHRVEPGRTSRVGVIRSTSINGESTSVEVALKFARAKVYATGSNKEKLTYWTGQIKATFYGNPRYCVPQEATPVPYSQDGGNMAVMLSQVRPVATVNDGAPLRYAARKNQFYLNNSLSSSNVGYIPGMSAESEKKGVKSMEGTIELRKHNFQWQKSTTPKEPVNPRKKLGTDVKPPEILGSIIVKYCSTVGLIYAGILPKPPDWDLEQLRKKRTKRDREHDLEVLANVKIEKIELSSDNINGRGEKVVEKRVVELIDLTLS